MYYDEYLDFEKEKYQLKVKLNKFINEFNYVGYDENAWQG